MFLKILLAIRNWMVTSATFNLFIVYCFFQLSFLKKFLGELLEIIVNTDTILLVKNLILIIEISLNNLTIFCVLACLIGTYRAYKRGF